MRKAHHVAVASITYNQEDYVKTLVESVRNQTYSRFISHHVSDDCSTDKTPELLNKYYDTFKLSQHSLRSLSVSTAFKGNDRGDPPDVNVGSNANFDQAVDMARSSHAQYIAFLEGDDYYKPDKIEKSVQFMLEKGYDAVATDIDADCADLRGMIPNAWKALPREIPEHITYDYLSYGNCIYTCTFVCKTECLNDAPSLVEFKERGYGVLGDYPLFLWLAKRFRIGYLDEALSVKRELPLSLSHNPQTYAEFAKLDQKVREDARAGLF